jgi:hypothetical protein
MRAGLFGGMPTSRPVGNGASTGGDGGGASETPSGLVV